MLKPLKEFLYFSRGERRGILLLTVAIILVFLAGHGLTHQADGRHTPTEEERQRQRLAVAQYDSFLASVRPQKPVQRKRYAAAPFNPNTADSATLVRLGMPGWMARNILRYREKGGKFRKPEDFRKIYGLTEARYKALLPYIVIPPEEGETDQASHRTEEKGFGRGENAAQGWDKDTTRGKGTAEERIRLYRPTAAAGTADTLRERVYKYPPGTRISLNRSDTTELKKIPGIGSGIARMIATYRQRLGGFYRIEQLQEINLDYRRLEPWFSIDSTEIRPINLNRAGVERLRNHPYINFYQAKAFVEHRRKKGKLNSLKVFALYEEFTADDLERIGHYVCFE